MPARMGSAAFRQLTRGLRNNDGSFELGIDGASAFLRGDHRCVGHALILPSPKAPVKDPPADVLPYRFDQAVNFLESAVNCR